MCAPPYLLASRGRAGVVAYYQRTMIMWAFDMYLAPTNSISPMLPSSLYRASCCGTACSRQWRALSSREMYRATAPFVTHLRRENERRAARLSVIRTDRVGGAALGVLLFQYSIFTMGLPRLSFLRQPDRAVGRRLAVRGWCAWGSLRGLAWRRLPAAPVSGVTIRSPSSVLAAAGRWALPAATVEACVDCCAAHIQLPPLLTALA